MIYCFDLDGTLCETHDGDYQNSIPLMNRIERVNKLHNEGHHIIVETARGSVTGKDWFEFTESQLKTWGVKYHELRTGVKKYANFYIDDKAILADEFFN